MLTRSTLLARLTAAATFVLGMSSCGADAGSTTPTDQAQAVQQTATPAAAEPIFNYIEYSPVFASAGQPNAAQLERQRAAGVQRVVYLAFSDQERSLPAEDRVVKELGMNYLQVPVDWKAPQKRDYDLFALAMQLEPERKTLLHCQANFRASAFALLYRVLELGVPLGQAKADMNSIWIPNATWTNFILQVLADNNVDTDCSACDWTPSTIGD